jgi:hypothetical protein
VDVKITPYEDNNSDIYNLDIWVDGQRRITVSLRSDRTSVQIPNSNVEVNQIPGSFYAAANR